MAIPRVDRGIGMTVIAGSSEDGGHIFRYEIAGSNIGRSVALFVFFHWGKLDCDQKDDECNGYLFSHDFGC